MGAILVFCARCFGSKGDMARVIPYGYHNMRLEGPGNNTVDCKSTTLLGTCTTNMTLIMEICHVRTAHFWFGSLPNRGLHLRDIYYKCL